MNASKKIMNEVQDLKELCEDFLSTTDKENKLNSILEHLGDLRALSKKNTFYVVKRTNSADNEDEEILSVFLNEKEANKFASRMADECLKDLKNMDFIAKKESDNLVGYINNNGYDDYIEFLVEQVKGI